MSSPGYAPSSDYARFMALRPERMTGDGQKAVRTPSRRFFNHLVAPVVLVTKGRGREVFNDSGKLFARFAELPQLGESILSIQTPIHAVSEDGIAALETMLATVGFRPFKVAGKRRGNPFSRFGTRWSWAYLSDYLGWQWRPLR